jgi:hypothetical protein
MPKGIFNRPSMPTRFWSKVDCGDPGECWEWTGSKTRAGYGRFWVGRKGTFATRISFELSTGTQIPEELFVLHRCDNPSCVNPSHLFLGTASDNQQDSVSKGRHHETRKTHCPKGHIYSPENTVVCRRPSPRTASRRCRACHNERVSGWGRARYLADPVYRDQIAARGRANYLRRKQERLLHVAA